MSFIIYTVSFYNCKIITEVRSQSDSKGIFCTNKFWIPITFFTVILFSCLTVKQQGQEIQFYIMIFTKTCNKVLMASFVDSGIQKQYSTHVKVALCSYVHIEKESKTCSVQWLEPKVTLYEQKALLLIQTWVSNYHGFPNWDVVPSSCISCGTQDLLFWVA